MQKKWEEKLKSFFKNPKKIFTYIGVLLMVCFILDKFSKIKEKKVQEFIILEKNVFQFLKNKDLELLKKIEEDFKKYPEIVVFYKTDVLQKLLEEKETIKEENFLKDKKESVYKDVSNLSFLISQKKYEKALEEAFALKTKIENKDSMLYFFNLLRIYSLNKKLQKKEDVKDIKNFIQKNPSLFKKFQKEKDFCLKKYFFNKKTIL